MKSRISSSKFTALRKDITRFAPLWGLYIVASILGLLTVINLYNNYSTPQDIATTMQLMPIASFGYALLAAQLLFGDLFNARMCNATHALPLTRNDWFGIHTTSGLLFAFVPHLLFTLMTLPFMGSLWQVSFWWMLAANLQYLFFFGTAVFCVFCTGSRFAMAVVYCLVNFLSMLAWWFADVLYQPLLYGIEMDFSFFQKLCPLVQMCTFEYVEVHRLADPILPGSLQTTYKVWYEMGEGWGYLAICAVIGIVLGAIGLLLYRKRNLEVAGDFIAVKFLEPVFLVLFSLAVGAVLQVTESLFIGTDGYLFLFVGIAIGFYLGRMLLLRTTRVFQLKSFFTLASLVGLLLASIDFVATDVLGIISWVPDAEEVKSVTIVSDFGNYVLNDVHYYDEAFTADTPEDIAILVDIHADILTHWNEDPYTPDVHIGGITVETAPGVQDVYTRIDFIYELEDGRNIHRYYMVNSKSDAGKIMHSYFSTVEAVLGKKAAEDLEDYIGSISNIYVSANVGQTIEDPEQLRQLIDAIIEDCEAGSMAQDWAFHNGEDLLYDLHIQYRDEVGVWEDTNYHTPQRVDTITVCASSRAVIAWLMQHNILPYDY
jgi:ABC-2 type transport system permease protein